MSTEGFPSLPKSIGSAAAAAQPAQAAAPFANSLLALYERHLLLDNGVDPAITNAREHYEAFARSIRDILAQRWVHTRKTYHNADPKRVYYLSMEFLIGRSLANNITNLLLDPVVRQLIDAKDLAWLEVVQKEPDAGLGNGG